MACRYGSVHQHADSATEHGRAEVHEAEARLASVRPSASYFSFFSNTPVLAVVAYLPTRVLTNLNRQDSLFDVLRLRERESFDQILLELKGGSVRQHADSAAEHGRAEVHEAEARLASVGERRARDTL